MLNIGQPIIRITGKRRNDDDDITEYPITLRKVAIDWSKKIIRGSATFHYRYERTTVVGQTVVHDYTTNEVHWWDFSDPTVDFVGFEQE